MKLPNWIRRHFIKDRVEPDRESPKTKLPLREFVYLDEVSLRSLLSSQKDGLPDSKSEQTVDALQAHLSSSIGANAPLVVSTEVKSSFQTSNSSTIQTSRKATVQSWFGELLKTEDIRLIEVIEGAHSYKTLDDLIATADCSVIIEADDLVRGSLVEFRVKLTADPVFRLGTVVSEFLGMAEDYPDMLAGGALANLKEVMPVYKVLQRLLAGLIPVRAEAIDHVVVSINGNDYVVHRDAVAQLKIECQPLEIVGVTEHLAYWKDIRRVLFSDAEFTLLGRIARSDLQSSWNPVKLADLFSTFDPSLSDKISAVSRATFEWDYSAPAVNSNEARLGDALHFYKHSYLGQTDIQLEVDQDLEIEKYIDVLKERVGSASMQRSAFEALKKKLSNLTNLEIEADDDLRLREEARNDSGLPLFPSLSETTVAPSFLSDHGTTKNDLKLLDLEIVAIYW